MNILCLDTSSEKIALGLIVGEQKYSFISEAGSKKHNSTLLIYIDELLHKHQLELNDIDCFGVVVGPGSFTGIRVGVATINSFALALNKPIIEITSLEQLFSKDDAMAVLDCKHDNFYCAQKQGDDIQYLALSGDELKNYDIKKLILNDVMPDEMMEKVAFKAEKKQFAVQAKPFYLKRSSAERESGIEC
jgi:tRNA threonylcarbamoyl adenosine modification protein YeaZ